MLTTGGVPEFRSGNGRNVLPWNAMVEQLSAKYLLQVNATQTLGVRPAEIRKTLFAPLTQDMIAAAFIDDAIETMIPRIREVLRIDRESNDSVHVSTLAILRATHCS